MISALPQDIIIHIASLFEYVWRALYQCDPLFAQYSRRIAGRKRFAREFTKIDKRGDRIEYSLCGELHREGDLPALIYVNGYQCWFIGGKLCRENDLPPAICPIGGRYYYINSDGHEELTHEPISHLTQWQCKAVYNGTYPNH